MNKLPFLIIIAVALFAGVVILAPMGESEAAGYNTYYQPYQSSYYSPYSSYNYGTQVPYGWQVYCPPGYTYTGSVCLWQGASYGYNSYGGGSPYNYGNYNNYNYPFNNSFFTGQYNYNPYNYNYGSTGNLDVDIKADDTSVDEGDRVKITWDVDGNATSCYDSNSRNDSDWNGYVDEDGDSDTVRPDRDTTYYIRCWNNLYSATDSVTVRVDEDNNDIRVTVWADDTHIDDGDSTRIRWDVDGNADRCDASNNRGDNDFEGRIDEDGGSITVRPDRDTKYTVECENGDSDSDSVTVFVD